jgi:hypothetical protein
MRKKPTFFVFRNLNVYAFNRNILIFSLYNTSSFPAACLRLKKCRFLTLDHMRSPFKNQNFEVFFLHVRVDQEIGPGPNFDNRSFSCFKLAQIRPTVKIPLKLGLLVASENDNGQTRFMFYKYR